MGHGSSEWARLKAERGLRWAGQVTASEGPRERVPRVMTAGGDVVRWGREPLFNTPPARGKAVHRASKAEETDLFSRLRNRLPPWRCFSS